MKPLKNLQKLQSNITIITFITLVTMINLVPVITIITFHFILNLHVIFDGFFVIKMLKQHSTTRNKQNPTVISSKSIVNVS